MTKNITSKICFSFIYCFFIFNNFLLFSCLKVASTSTRSLFLLSLNLQSIESSHNVFYILNHQINNVSESLELHGTSILVNCVFQQTICISADSLPISYKHFSKEIKVISYVLTASTILNQYLDR